jgi:hypothetical protein
MAPLDPQALVVDEVGHRVSYAGDAVRARHIVFSALEPADFALDFLEVLRGFEEREKLIAFYERACGARC